MLGAWGFGVSSDDGLPIIALATAVATSTISVSILGCFPAIDRELGGPGLGTFRLRVLNPGSFF